MELMNRVSGPRRARAGEVCLTMVLAALLLLTTALAFAQVDLVSVDPLRIDVSGQRVVDGWHIDPEVGEVETWRVEAEGWEQVHHRWAVGEGWKLRQEIAARGDRLEITQLRFFETGTTGISAAGVILPLETFDGARFECVGSPVGDARRDGRVATGTLGSDGVRRINNLEYLRVHLPGGGVDFDANPRGAWYTGPGMGPAVVRFTLLRYADGWRLWSADGKAGRGTIHDFKLVVTPANETPVGDVHPPVNTRWTEPWQPTSRVNVGTFEVDRFDASVRPDGELSRDERFVGVAGERVEGAAVTDGTLTLILPVERDGIYLVSLLAGDPERAIGPCWLDGGVGEPRETPRVEAGEYDCWVTPGRAVDGAIAVTLSGDARICALQAAPMIFANEDYLLERGWWVSTQFHEEDDLPL
ncbi:MAG: hypothetical protein ACOX9R_11730 [Armatimonadota bacterium]|jgi:hypothetical protein